MPHPLHGVRRERKVCGRSGLQQYAQAARRRGDVPQADPRPSDDVQPRRGARNLTVVAGRIHDAEVAPDLRRVGGARGVGRGRTDVTEPAVVASTAP
ncbi:hypothetical protein PSU4_04120 [Pseudonocardia sulfidoxydans NBRC 16205]|uniref:Uncharacterized protein n=1 Tax=Pseudonocardia sulfidoxydans NBRC 16205 TaxID=1223511 RepID=A0A511DEQ3_9PSEU|nr:hypothetical protein PSU4_04120 [Pseudonocardia sulfidoxydans NBRC 16205]